eukprot:jgi/Mesvir1/16932/Mv15791-RA.1
MATAEERTQQLEALRTFREQGVTPEVVRKHSEENIPGNPSVIYAVANATLKGEDRFAVEPVLKRPYKKGDTVVESTFGCYMVYDGHNGAACAEYCTEQLLQNVLNAMEANVEWSESLKRAMVKGFHKTDADFGAMNRTAGCTATLVVVEGWTVTVAGVGDSRCIAILEDGTIVPLTEDHRLEDNPAELQRVVAAGCQVARLHTSDGMEVGPLRAWPGGLCLSRAIGDSDVGPFINCLPEVKQLRIPFCNCRIVVASDGVWDAMSNKAVYKAAIDQPTEKSAAKIIKETLKQRGLRDDTTCIVVDLFRPDVEIGPKSSPSPFGKPQTGIKKLFSSSSTKKKGGSIPSSPKEHPDEALYKERLIHAGGVWCSGCKAYILIGPIPQISIHGGTAFCKKHAIVDQHLVNLDGLEELVKKQIELHQVVPDVLV